MQSLEEMATELTLQLWDATNLEEGKAFVNAAAAAIRHNALEEARDTEPAGGDHVNAGGWYHGYAAGVNAKRAAIAALIDLPPSAPPERPEIDNSKDWIDTPGGWKTRDGALYEAAPALRPCPFCGFFAHVILDRGDLRRRNTLWRPQCKQCGGGLGGFDTMNLAIAPWNWRDPAAIVPDPENVEQLKCVSEAIATVHGGRHDAPPDDARAVLTALRDVK